MMDKIKAWCNRDGSWSTNAPIIAAKAWGCTPALASVILFERVRERLKDELGPMSVSFTLQGSMVPVWEADVR